MSGSLRDLIVVFRQNTKARDAEEIHGLRLENERKVREYAFLAELEGVAVNLVRRWADEAKSQEQKLMLLRQISEMLPQGTVRRPQKSKRLANSGQTSLML